MLTKEQLYVQDIMPEWADISLALVQRNWLLGYRIAGQELRAEIEMQKEMFYLQQQEKKRDSVEKRI